MHIVSYNFICDALKKKLIDGTHKNLLECGCRCKFNKTWIGLNVQGVVDGLGFVWIYCVNYL